MSLNPMNRERPFFVPKPEATAAEAIDAAFLALEMAQTSMNTLLDDFLENTPKSEGNAFSMKPECVMGCIYSTRTWLEQIEQALFAHLDITKRERDNQ